MLDRRDSAQIDDEALEALEVPSAALREQDRLSQLGPAESTELLVTVEHDKLPMRSDRQCLECPLKTAVEHELTGMRSAPSTPPLIVRHLDVMDEGATFVLRRKVAVASKTKAVVQKTRRRHRGPSFGLGTKEDRPPGGDFSTHDNFASDTAIPTFAR
jgi:hypothetical protein